MNQHKYTPYNIAYKATGRTSKQEFINTDIYKAGEGTQYMEFIYIYV